MDAIEFIEKEEGRVLHSYQDSAGVWTIGIGSTRYMDGKHVGANEAITDTQADALRDWELNNKSSAIRGLLNNTVVNDNQFAALLSFTYNEGVGALANSALLKKVKANPNDTTIRQEFAKWNKIHVDGKLVSSPGLSARRKRESLLYFSQDNL